MTSEPIDTIPKATEELRGFFEEYPLFSKYRLRYVPKASSTLIAMLPQSVRLHCPTCKLINPFRRTHYDSLDSSPNSLGLFGLECTGCVQQTAHFLIEFDREKQWARKIGQLPEWDISLEPDLEKALGPDADLYKRAKICVGQSFGVGACTYLRRVLENRITPLLQIIRQNREEDNADPEELAQIDEIIQGRVADEKIKLAREVLPDTLLVEGDNPLGFIYDQLSVALHRKDKLECTEVARELLDPVRNIILYLSQEQEQRQRRRGFGETIKALRRRLHGER